MPGSLLTNLPKSQYTSDPALRPFLGPSFDPTAYLNSTLPSVYIASAATPVIPRDSSTITDLTSITQSQLTELSALSARLTTTLTQLTDDILRSGARLAYDVELLRGEAVTLTEILTDGLAAEINQFVPKGVTVPQLDKDRATKLKGRSGSLGRIEQFTPENDDPEDSVTDVEPAPEPEALTRLRSLQHIRSRLQSVITTFDLALSWPLPPSVTSMPGSSFIAVSSPSSGTPSTPSSTPESLEIKGQAAQQRIRSSVTELLAIDRGPEGVLKAEERIDQLKDLVGVWKGTGEERYRTKFVENLAKMVSDRRKDEEAKGTLAKREISGDQDIARRDETEKGTGLLGGLRRLRDEIYLD